jgi:ketosteroid isomerase-like protein
MPQGNLEVIRRVIAALNERDIDGYLSCCTEDLRLQPAWSAVQGDYEGRDGIRRFFSDLGDTLPDFRLEIEDLEPVRTTRVLALLRVHATTRASGIAAGQPEASVGTPTATIYDFAEGKIERIRVLLDRDEARELAGRP